MTENSTSEDALREVADKAEELLDQLEFHGHEDQPSITIGMPELVCALKKAGYLKRWIVVEFKDDGIWYFAERYAFEEDWRIDDGEEYTILHDEVKDEA